LKKLMLGNEAIARGLYEAGVNLVLVIQEHHLQKLLNAQLSTTRFIVNGHQMKK